MIAEIVHDETMASISLACCPRALVENRFGITILPRTALGGINLSKLEVVRLAPKPIREEGIAAMRSLSQSPAARSFKECLATTRLVPFGEDSH